MFDKLRPQYGRKLVEIGISPTIKAEEIRVALERIYELAGCTGCGLGGYDVHLRVLPEEIVNVVRDLRQFDTIQSVDIHESGMGGD